MADRETTRLVRDATDRLVAALEAGESDQLKAYLSAMGRFHAYSPGNVLLISIQYPEASRVAGYGTWKSLGRQVRRGEKGIRILAPIVHRTKENEKDPERIVSFKTANVFDIRQTEGRPLPEFAQTKGDPGKLLGRMRAVIRGRGLALIHMEGSAGVQGWSGHGRIAVRRGLAPAEEFSTMVHELAHAILHDGASGDPSRKVRETEAEAVAFVVCEAVGLDTNSAAVDYLRLYDGDRKTLVASLNRIQETASGILGDLEANSRRRAGSLRGVAQATNASNQRVEVKA